jgi:hypothetical protein
MCSLDEISKPKKSREPVAVEARGKTVKNKDKSAAASTESTGPGLPKAAAEASSQSVKLSRQLNLSDDDCLQSSETVPERALTASPTLPPEPERRPNAAAARGSEVDDPPETAGASPLPVVEVTHVRASLQLLKKKPRGGPGRRGGALLSANETEVDSGPSVPPPEPPAPVPSQREVSGRETTANAGIIPPPANSHNSQQRMQFSSYLFLIPNFRRCSETPPSSAPPTYSFPPRRPAPRPPQSRHAAARPALCCELLSVLGLHLSRLFRPHRGAARDDAPLGPRTSTFSPDRS